MLFKSTFLQSSSIWKVMSALFITVRDALGQISQQYDKSKHTHIPYQLCSFIWILLKNIQTTIGTWHRWFNDVCRFRIWENLLDTEIQKEKKYNKSLRSYPINPHVLKKQTITLAYFMLTFKFDIPQVFWKVMKCYFKPLIELFGKFSNDLS